MSIEDLLKPRWKVIADYPGTEFELNEIIYCDEYGQSLTYNDNGRLRIHCESYHAIFKRIYWHEERKEDEMPEYVKDECRSVHKVIYWDGENMVLENGESYEINKDVMCFFYPATESEYLEFQNQKQ